MKTLVFLVLMYAWAAPKNPVDYLNCSKEVAAPYWATGPRLLSQLNEAAAFPGKVGGKDGFFFFTGEKTVEKVEFCPLPTRPYKPGVKGADRDSEEMHWYKISINGNLYYADQGVADRREILVRHAVDIPDQEKKDHVPVTCAPAAEKDWSGPVGNDIGKRLDGVKSRMAKPDVKPPPNDSGMYASLDRVIAACSKVLEGRDKSNALKGLYRPVIFSPDTGAKEAESVP